MGFKGSKMKLTKFPVTKNLLIMN